MEEPVKKFFRLAPGKEVRLKGAYFITCTDVIKDEMVILQKFTVHMILKLRAVAVVHVRLRAHYIGLKRLLQ